MDAERAVTVLANFAPVADKMLADWASGTAQRDLSHDLDTEEVPLTHIGKPHRRSRSPPPVMGHEARTGRDPNSRTLAQPYGAPLIRSPQELWTNLVRAFLRAQHSERIRNMRTSARPLLRTGSPLSLKADAAAPLPPLGEIPEVEKVSHNYKPARRVRPLSEGDQPPTAPTSRSSKTERPPCR